MPNIEFNKELQKFSQHVYGNGKSQSPQGWIQISQKANQKTGFYAETYVKGKELVIVFRGTDTQRGIKEFAYDVSNDMDLYLGDLPYQAVDAREYYNEVKKEFKDYHITFTGHSLAGSLSQIMSYETGEDAVTFNAYGVKHILNTSKTPPNIINYGNANDPVFIQNIDNQFGKTYIMNNYPNAEGTVYKEKGFNTNVSLEDHFMENIGDISNAKEYTPSTNKPILLKGSVSYDDFSPERIITNEEIGKMSQDEFEKKEKYINQQMKKGKVMPATEAERRSKSEKKESSKSNKSSNSSNSDGKWVTINGNHVLLED